MTKDSNCSENNPKLLDTQMSNHIKMQGIKANDKMTKRLEFSDDHFKAAVINCSNE